MISGKRLAEWAKAQIGRSYDDVDCKELIVEGIRTLGTTSEEENYRCGHTNELWRSLKASGKYKYITERLTIKEARVKGRLLPGAILAIHEEGYNAKFDDWEGDCSHVALYIGDDEYEAIHSSETREMVCGTKVSNGFTHVLIHRLINLDSAEPEEAEDEAIEEIEMIVVTEKDPLNIRKKPTSKADSIGKAEKNSVVIVTGAVETDEKGRKWAPVRFTPANRRTAITGYACMDYLAINGRWQELSEEEAGRSLDMVSVPREVILVLADAVYEAERSSESARTWRECLEAIDALIHAAKNTTAYLKGDD